MLAIIMTATSLCLYAVLVVQSWTSRLSSCLVSLYFLSVSPHLSAPPSLLPCLYFSGILLSFMWQRVPKFLFPPGKPEAISLDELCSGIWRDSEWQPGERVGVLILACSLVRFFIFYYIIFTFSSNHAGQTQVKKLTKGSRLTHNSCTLVLETLDNNKDLLSLRISLYCRSDVLVQRKMTRSWLNMDISWTITQYNYAILIILWFPSVSSYPVSEVTNFCNS